jgi:DNA-binding transcriptional ArsR family regulator
MRVMPRRAAPLAPIEPPETAVDAARPSTGVAVVTKERAAGALVAPTRRKILALLQAPGSATTVASRLGLSRQLANYHIRALEKAGLVEEVDRRQKRGLEERLVRATAAHYLVSPDTFGLAAGGPEAVADRFSATYQVAVAARTIREIADLAERARRAGKRLTTLTLDTVVRFATPAAREAFGNEFIETITGLVAKYHDGQSADGRTYRLFAGAHPVASATGTRRAEGTEDRPKDKRPRRRSPGKRNHAGGER